MARTWFKPPTVEGVFNMHADIWKIGISKCAILLYGYLCSCASIDGVAAPGNAAMREACSVKSRTTIDKALRELEAAGVIAKTWRREGGNASWQIR